MDGAEVIWLATLAAVAALESTTELSEPVGLERAIEVAMDVPSVDVTWSACSDEASAALSTLATLATLAALAALAA